MNDGGNYTYNFKPKNADFKSIWELSSLPAVSYCLSSSSSIVYNAFTFRVDERQQAVVMQFNKVVKIIVDDDRGRRTRCGS